MITRDYLQMAGITKDELAEKLGHKSTSSVTKKMDVEMPKRWARLLDAEDTATTAVGSDSDEARAHTVIGEEGEPDWEQAFRETPAPEMPTDPSVIGPQRIKLTTVEGYIQMIYGGAASIADNRGDSLAADVIRRYSPEFSEAWITYIQSDPRIMEYLEKMMIGTPLGNLIGVHVIAIGSYAFARAAARQIANAHHAESESASANGTVDDSARDFMA